jgi:hypothetical protein
MIQTLSQFYYGHEVGFDNRYLNFSENGGDELTAEIDPGSYSLTDFCSAVAAALNSASELYDYTVTVDRSTRIITISADGDFEIL